MFLNMPHIVSRFNIERLYIGINIAESNLETSCEEADEGWKLLDSVISAILSD